MKKTIAAIAILSFAAVGAAAQDNAQTSRSFDVRGFDRIDMAGCDIATVTLGSGFAVTVQGRAGNIANLRIDTTGGALRIRRRDNSCNGHDRRVAIAITLPSIKAVEVSGAAELNLPALDAERFDAQTSGAGVLRLTGLGGTMARLGLSGASQVTVQNVHIERLALDLSGASVLRASGQARQMMLATSGASNVDTRELPTPDAKISASGIAKVRATVIDQAQVDASGMANVTVEGHPQCTVEKSGLARVSCGR